MDIPQALRMQVISFGKFLARLDNPIFQKLAILASFHSIVKNGPKTHSIGNNFACTVQVGGMGLGDDLMAALAMVMPILRSVERLVAFDNRMTDFSLFRVVLAVQGMPSLTHLGKGRP